LGTGINAKIDKLDARIDRLEIKMDGKFKLHSWMLGVVTAGMGIVTTGVVSLVFKAYF